MKKLHASIFINAPRQKVWDSMLQDETYREWTSAFNPGSYYRGSWTTGSEMLFLGPSPDGTGGEGGMVSHIEEVREPEFVSVKHLGIIKDGVRLTDGPEVEQWAPSFENYTFTEKDGGTEVSIDMDIEESYHDEFLRYWNGGLEKLKAIAER
jgi:uncharacterized protein YndB with AHSA1/START domain